MRAISDAGATDKLFEEDWSRFLCGFEEAGQGIIEEDQRQGLIPDFDPRPVVVTLNRMNASTLIEAFGTRPRKRPEPILAALSRVWVSSLYGSEWAGKESSDLIRT